MVKMWTKSERTQASSFCVTLQAAPDGIRSLANSRDGDADETHLASNTPFCSSPHGAYIIVDHQATIHKGLIKWIARGSTHSSFVLLIFSAPAVIISSLNIGQK
jgi:hypothetical protein